MTNSYKEYICAYIERLSEQLAKLGVPDFQDVYIVNERGDLTDSGSTHVSIIRDLAQEVNAMGKTARCSFAGEYQMANADPCLYDCLKPAFNIYPSLSFKDGRSTPTDDLVKLMDERLATIGTFWQGRYDMSGIVLSEIGTRPALRALRAPEAYKESDVGAYYGDAMILFWTAFAEFARKMNFEYICVWYWDRICDWYEAAGCSDVPDLVVGERKYVLCNGGSEIADRMYGIFIKM